MSKIVAQLMIAFDTDLPREDRRLALLEANSLRKAAKVGWAKVQDMSQGQYDDLLELLSQPEVAPESPSQPEVTPAEKFAQVWDEALEFERRLAMAEMTATVDAAIWVDGYHEVLVSLVGPDVEVVTTPSGELPKRGEVGRMVMLLLETTELPYHEIVGRVRAKWPSAATTARSIASVAADMRRNGVEVASRRATKA